MYLTPQACRSRLEEAERELDQLEGKSENFSGTTDEETEMLETLKAQHEAVEAERKVRVRLFSPLSTKVIVGFPAERGHFCLLLWTRRKLMIFSE